MAARQGGCREEDGGVANLEDHLEECSEEYKRTNGSNLTSTALLSTTHTHTIIKLPTVSLPSCMQQHRRVRAEVDLCMLQSSSEYGGHAATISEHVGVTFGASWTKCEAHRGRERSRGFADFLRDTFRDLDGYDHGAPPKHVWHRYLRRYPSVTEDMFCN